MCACVHVCVCVWGHVERVTWLVYVCECATYFSSHLLCADVISSCINICYGLNPAHWNQTGDGEKKGSANACTSIDYLFKTNVYSIKECITFNTLFLSLLLLNIKWTELFTLNAIISINRNWLKLWICGFGSKFVPLMDVVSLFVHTHFGVSTSIIHTLSEKHFECFGLWTAYPCNQ